jgi:hypothetical protein
VTGMGSKIENVSFVDSFVNKTSHKLYQYHRTSPFDAILGGAEDVMGDMGVRQALKKMPKSARL